jgi:hypothetical protein
MPDLTVTVDNVDFIRANVRRTDKVRFIIGPDGFDGWDDSTDMRREEIAIPQGHGAFDVPGFLSPRVVALSGHAVALSPEYLDEGRSVLTGLLADGDSGRIIVHGYGPTQWADGRKASKTQFKVLGSNPRVAKFQAQFWCANPRKFGDVRRHPDGSPWPFASGEPASHYGNFPATPVHVVSGAMSGYAINGPAGKAKVVTVPVVSGHPHTIDDATGYLSIDGVIVAGGMSQADTWSIPAGAQVTHTLVPASGSGTLATTVLDTFI